MFVAHLHLHASGCEGMFCVINMVIDLLLLKSEKE
jgi:hypothetical protein